MTTNGDPVAIGYNSGGYNSGGYNGSGYNSRMALEDKVDKLAAQVEQLIKLITKEEIESPIAKKVQRLLESKKTEMNVYGQAKFSNSLWSNTEVCDMMTEFIKQGYSCVSTGNTTILVTL